MPDKKRPDIFVSATSDDLRSVREVVKQLLLKMGCFPVEQSNFPVEYRSVAEMLRKKISECDAVIHVVGMHYGSEPPLSSVPSDEPRRSFTQLEADVARELGKPVYLFVCSESFPYDQRTNPESAEKRRIQKDYRKEMLADLSRMRYEVESVDEIESHVASLETRFDRLKLGNDRVKRFTLASFVAILVVLLLLGVRGWWLGQTVDATEQAVQANAEQAADTKDAVTNAAKAVDRTEGVVREIDRSIKGKPLEDLKRVWAETSDQILGLSTRMISPEQISLDRATEIAGQWGREVSLTTKAVSQLRAALVAALETTEEIDAVEAVANQLKAIAGTTRDLAILGNDWTTRRGRREIGGLAVLHALDSFGARGGYLANSSWKLIRQYVDLAVDLREEMAVLLGEKTDNGQVAARRLQRRALRLKKLVELLFESKLIPRDARDDLRERFDAAKAALSKSDLATAISLLEKIRREVRERSGERAKMQALVVAPKFLDIVWVASEGGTVADAKEYGLKVHVAALGIDFDASSIRGRANELPRAAVKILEEEFLPAVAEQWGEECKHTAKAGYTLYYISKGLDPAFVKARQGDLLPLKSNVRYGSKDRLLFDVSLLIKEMELAHLPESVIAAARDLERSVQSFDFANEYRARNSTSHGNLTGRLVKLVQLILDYIKPHVEAVTFERQQTDT